MSAVDEVHRILCMDIETVCSIVYLNTFLLTYSTAAASL